MTTQTKFKTVDRQLTRFGLIGLTKLLFQSGVTKTASEARRLIEQRAVKLNGQTIDQPDAEVVMTNGLGVIVGRQHYTLYYKGLDE